MVEKYVPKVGDKVRATCGVLALAGRVDLVGDYGVHLDPGLESLETYVCWNDDPWHFEQIVSVPTKFGAVIRNNVGGELYVRTNKDDKYPWTPLNAPDEWETDARGTAGGFSVLFDGVDE